MTKLLWRSGVWVWIGVLLLGVWFRVAYLDRKVVWVDEVATSFRIAGYTKAEITEQLVAQRQFPVTELQRYQQLSPEKDWEDTMAALVRSPEHAPLYFLLARGWVQTFGSSIAVLRSLSVVCGLVALPCLYWLCWEWVRSPGVGAIAVALLAVSPFYTAYSQEARPYSLWVVTILGSSALLLRSLRLQRTWLWVGYAIALSAMLYTSLLSVLVAIGQGVYVFGVKGLGKGARAYRLAASLAMLAFLPWIWVVVQQWEVLEQNTTWMQVAMPLPAMVAVWLYSLVIMFVSFPVSTVLSPVIVTAIAVDLALLGLMAYSFYSLCKQSSKSIWLFAISLTMTPAALISLDLIQNGQRSTAPRYFIPLQLAVLLAIAWLLAKFSTRRSTILLALILSLGIGSGVVYLDRSPQYQKTRNLHNPAIATLINQADSPLVWAEVNNAMDLISLSYDLDPDAQIYLSPQLDLSELPSQTQSIFLFNPSATLRQTLQQQSVDLEPIYNPKRLIQDEISLTLWRINPEPDQS
jgi:uncharacterized membrane protein